MDPNSSGSEAQEALETLQQFLSDSIPPLQALDSVTRLMTRDPELTATGIGTWALGCYRGQSSDFLLSDLLFLAMKRLCVFGELRLLPPQELRAYLELVVPFVLRLCPEEEYALLKRNLELLGNEEEPPTLVAEASLFPPEAGAGAAGRVIERITRSNRTLSLLFERVGKLPNLRGAAASGSVAPVVPQLVGETVRRARSAEELQLAEQAFEVLGLPVRTDLLLRVLAEGMPGWNLPSSSSPADPVAGTHSNSMLEAMRRLIQLAGSNRASTQRWRDLVKSAVAQISQGSLQRASAMIGLAESLLANQPVDSSALAQARSVTDQGLGIEALRPFVEDTRNQPHLRRIMSFFEEFRPGVLLEQLAVENNRTRRRLLLQLLEAHGESARAGAARILEQAIASGDHRLHWHLPRNLVYLLHRIRPADGQSDRNEMAILQRLLDPGGPASLVKEAVTYFGQLKSPESEKILMSFLGTLERVLKNPADPSASTAAALSLLDRTAAAIAGQGTREAIRAVCTHGLEQRPEFGNTAARLVSLATHDVSCDPGSVTRIVEAAAAALPRRVMGLKVRRLSGDLQHYVAALSSTPTREVQELMQTVAERAPELEAGQAAAKYLRQVAEGGSAEGPGSRKLMGDLDLFGLADLLQQLERTEASGTLVVTDRNGRTTGTLDLEKGKILSCRSGRLCDEEAIYSLFEKPASGTFVFQRGPEPRMHQDTGRKVTAPSQLIVEGASRYDEFQWLRAVAPDDAVLSPSGLAPEFQDADDPELSRCTWERISRGETPGDCEFLAPAEPLRIRRLIAQWIEEGFLVESSGAPPPPPDA